jgi:PAS domain S-box-containing protein
MLPKPLPPFKLFLTLVFGLGLVAGLDRGIAFLFGEQTLAPLISLLILAGFSFFLSPAQILLSIPLFAFESFVLIREASAYPLVRTATVFLGGALAWAVRTERLKIFAQLVEVDNLLSQLPAPWLMVDSSGNILQASRAAIATLGMSLSQLQTLSFSYLFSPNEKKGDFIQTFLKVVDHHEGVSGLELICRHSGQAYYASLAPLSNPRRTLVLVVLSPKESP